MMRHTPVRPIHVLVLVLLFPLACKDDENPRSDADDARTVDISADHGPTDLLEVSEDGPDDVQIADQEDPDDTGTADYYHDVRGWAEYAFEARDLVRYVDPMIGTQGSGNVIPGALLPHGMVRASPLTTDNANDVAAYSYSSTQFRGLSHTHLEGAGGSANGYSQILVFPTVGALTAQSESYTASFSHDDEEARPGYYGVALADSGIALEVVSTRLAALHRYTFRAEGTPRLVFNLGHSLGKSTGGELTFSEGKFVSGFADYQVHPVVSTAVNDRKTGDVRIFFSIEVDQQYAEHAVWRAGDEDSLDYESTEIQGRRINGAIGFEPGTPITVEMRLGLSLISVEQARLNADTELGDSAFEDLRVAASDQWNERLNRIQVEGSDDDLTVFYTALYHSMFQPADYTETGSRFLSAAGGDGQVFEARQWRYLTDDWCLWDTYRTSHPLRTIVEPDIIDDYVRSLLHVRAQGGWLPKCPWNASGYSRVMTGNPAIPIIVDAFVKGFERFDTTAAFEAVVDLSMNDDNPFPMGLCGYLGLGTPSEYVENGFVSHECDASQSASMTMEFAYADWCVAEMAERLGRDDEEALFRQRAQNFQHHWDAEVGFMRGRHENGGWVDPFDPADTSDMNDFVEASSWIFTFFVPHDVPALVQLIGGPDDFVTKLDQFFDDGHYDPTNQPSFHIPFLYNFAGAADRTQERVRRTLSEEYQVGPGGLPGNDDAGATSAWYVLGALGIFPVAPCAPIYDLSSPIFSRAEIFLASGYQSGTSFVIRVDGDPADTYIQSASLNGDPLERPWISHDELAVGGELVFVLGPEPSGWGANRSP